MRKRNYNMLFSVELLVLCAVVHLPTQKFCFNAILLLGIIGNDEVCFANTAFIRN